MSKTFFDAEAEQLKGGDNNMGDRCWLQMTIARADMARFDEVLDGGWGQWYNEGEQTEDGFHAEMYEVNYGMANDRDELAGKGLTFFGSHGEGGTYGAYAFVSYRGKHLEIPVDHDGIPFASVYQFKSGHVEVSQGMINAAKRYYELEEKARQEIKGKDILYRQF